MNCHMSSHATHPSENMSLLDIHALDDVAAAQGITRHDLIGKLVQEVFDHVLPARADERSLAGLGLTYRQLLIMLATAGAVRHVEGLTDDVYAQAVSGLMEALTENRVAVARFRSQSVVTRVLRSIVPPVTTPSYVQIAWSDERRDAVRAVISLPPTSMAFTSLYGAELPHHFSSISPVPFLRRGVSNTVPVLAEILRTENGFTVGMVGHANVRSRSPLGMMVGQIPQRADEDPQVVPGQRFTLRPCGDGEMVIDRAGRIIWHHDRMEIAALSRANVARTVYGMQGTIRAGCVDERLISLRDAENGIIDS